MSKELENRVIAATKQYQAQKRKAEALEYELEEYKKKIKEMENRMSQIPHVENNDNILDNYILAIYKIDKEDINKKIQIINCNKDNSNKKMIENSCEIFLNNEKINFSYFYTFNKEGEYTFKFNFNTKLTNISFLFYNCINLISIDFSHFIGNNISTMRSLFRKCIHLIKVDFTNFNTENVSDMSNMFWECNELKDIDLSSFNTRNVFQMNAMFSDCNSLTNLNLSNFNTQKVLDMSYMFAHCNNLKKLNLKNFKIKENTDVSDIYYCLNKDCEIISDEKKMIELKDTES